jgi:DUF1680 family protein
MNAQDAQRRELLRALATAPWLAAAPLAATAQPTARTDTFDIASVRLLGGPFKRAQELTARYLRSLQADRLLHGFRVNAGLTPKAPVYGGWESEAEWLDLRCQGHTLGHYLSACAMMWAATGEVEFRRRADYVVRDLAACQQAASSGLVCAFPDGDTQLRNGLAGRAVTGVPWYTLHKVAAGLRDAHTHAGNALALVVLRRLADWIEQAAADCSDAQFERMLDVEHGGMNEVLADLAALSGESRYLALARRFNHRRLLAPLAEGRDELDGLHANTQIPKVVGFARLGEITGEAPLRQAASYFWGRVSGPRAFATGGHGDGEHFFAPTEVRRHLDSAKTMETCGIHNMLRLTRVLFRADAQVAYADWTERALINGILASQDPDSGMATYFQPLRPGYPKLYGTPEQSFWCCTGTGMENHARYGESIFAAEGRVLYVSQYIAANLAWREHGLHVSLVSAFPEQGRVRLMFSAEKVTPLTLRLRHPAWCRLMTVRVNGQAVLESREAGRWVDVERSWRNGDRVDIDLPMHLTLQPLPQAPEVAALMYGPMVLAARMGTDGIGPGDDQIVNERRYGDVLQRAARMPRLALSGRELHEVVRQVGSTQRFRAQSPVDGAEVEWMPYYQIAHERYSLHVEVA